MECKFKRTVHRPRRDSAVKHHSHGLHADKVPEIEARKQQQQLAHDVSPAGGRWAFLDPGKKNGA
jgi:hypothetical protein